MSTIPKEIQEKIKAQALLTSQNKTNVDYVYNYFIDGAELCASLLAKDIEKLEYDAGYWQNKAAGYQLATDGLEELEKNVLIFVAKELGEHKVRQGYSYSEACDLVFKYNAALHSSLNEKEKELKETQDDLHKEQCDWHTLRAENSRLLEKNDTLQSSLKETTEEIKGMKYCMNLDQKNLEELKAEVTRLRIDAGWQSDC